MFEARDDHARGTPRQHFVNHGFLAVGQVVGDADNGLQAGAFQRFGNAGHHLGEDHVRQGRDITATRFTRWLAKAPAILFGT